MLAKEIYTRFDSDFIKPEISDDWYRYMSEIVRHETKLYQRMEYFFKGLLNKE